MINLLVLSRLRFVINQISLHLYKITIFFNLKKAVTKHFSLKKIFVLGKEIFFFELHKGKNLFDYFDNVLIHCRSFVWPIDRNAHGLLNES